MAGSARRSRIQAELQRVLADLIAREVRDPRVGNVTITAVEVAADMSYARVFFVPFAKDSPASAAAVQDGLSRAAGFLRGEVGRRLSLRHAPQLRFELDKSIEYGARLSELIDDAVGRDRLKSADDGD